MPYGYENKFSNIKKSLSTKSSETARRIRYSPDLLIYDSKEQDVHLVEVKMSKNEYVNINKIEDYQKYWNDAIIVAVIVSVSVTIEPPILLDAVSLCH